MPTRGELMYFAIGLALGGVAGANWAKIKPFLDTFLGPAAEGFGEGYSDIARMFADRFESFQDGAAERRHQAKASRNGSSHNDHHECEHCNNGKPKRKRKTKAAQHSEPFARA